MGGVETYLNSIIPELARAGHEIAFLCEVDESAERERIELPQKSPLWCVSDLGEEKALASLRDWQPDVIYTHKLMSPALEAKTLLVAPSVFFAHDYNGTCISGTKTHRFPVVKPCQRRFGWPCLVHYFPRRCGGLSPLTMASLYRLQSKRLALLHRYSAIVTHSKYMLEELIRHGLSPHTAYSFPYYVRQHDAQIAPFEQSPQGDVEPLHSSSFQSQKGSHKPNGKSPVQLIFSGRMELLKGGHVFLDALPQVALSLGKPLRVVFAGDGRKRREWEEMAARVRRLHEEIEIEFVGWVEYAQMDMLLDSSDLLVVPSLWPEPFGLVGPEAGLRGVPAAAFAVGGVPDWLVNGVNGYMADGDPPTAEGLAQAIVNCLRDPARYASLRHGAVKIAQQFSIKNHLTILTEVFERVISY